MRGSGLVAIGRVAGAHGLRGHLKITWLGDGPEHLLEAHTLWLARRPDDPLPRRYAVRSSLPGGGRDVVIALAGVADRPAAEALKGQLVQLPASQLTPLGEDEFYWHELVGASVELEDGSPLGVVRELWDIGPHDLLVVDAPGGQTHLIPTVREFVVHIGRDARRIVVRPIEGLLEADGPDPAAPSASSDPSGGEPEDGCGSTS